MATPAEDRWPYPRLWCPVCQRGCETVEDLVDHQLSRRHWPQTTPEALCARLLAKAVLTGNTSRILEVSDCGEKSIEGQVAKAPAVDPAQAQQLREALEAAEARQQEG
jgi:hypothetical protein